MQISGVNHFLGLFADTFPFYNSSYYRLCLWDYERFYCPNCIAGKHLQSQQEKLNGSFK
jgi:hypothetical protein